MGPALSLSVKWQVPEAVSLDCLESEIGNGLKDN
nr:MAG TPA: hypothetical protein [Microviridae sp.]